MNVYLFLKSLTKDEKISLAAETDRKVSYLNYLASARDGMSVRFASSIFESEVNSARPPGQRFTFTDYKKFRRTWLINRGLEM